MEAAAARGRRSGRAALAALLLAAAALRLVGIGFGLPYPYANVDEHIVLDRAVVMAGGEPNPGYFAYPSLCFELHALLARLVCTGGIVTGAWDSYAGFRAGYWLDPAPVILASRLLTAALAVASVWAVARLGREAWRALGPRATGAADADARRRAARIAGLGSAAALAFSYLHVANSRWVTVDAPVVLFATLALARALRHRRRGRARDLLLAALFAGLAASSKYYGALLALPIAVAALAAHGAPAPHPPGAARSLPRRLRLLAAAAVVMIGSFLLASPYVALDFEAFRRDFGTLQQHVEGGHFGHDPERAGPLAWARLLAGRHVGAWLLAPAALGLLASGRGRAALAVLLAQPAAHFALLSTFKAQPPDYLLPLLPALCALAGIGLGTIASHPALRPRPMRARAAALAAAAPLLLGASLGLKQGLELRRPDTRVLLGDWLARELPAGASIAADSWLGLPLTVACLEAMRDGRLRGDAVPFRRSRDEPLEQLEARLAAARARTSGPAFDFALLTPRETGLLDALPPLLRENGFRWLVLDGRLAARTGRSGAAFQDRAGWYRRMLEGDWVIARFDPAADAASGPPLHLIDLDRLPRD